MFSLENQIAIVTGGANGIGQGIVESLAKAGAKVVIADIDEENGQKVANDVSGDFFKLDVTNEENAQEVVDAVAEKYGKIDILAANTGIYPDIKIEEMTEEDWDKVFDINLKGMFFIVKPVLKVMKENNYGRVIVTSSVTGPDTGYPGGAAYGATKAGILGFIKSAAMEYAKFNVTVNAVQPGVVATEALKEQLADLSEGAAEYIPMKKLGDPEDIGTTVSFFASQEAKYITGQSLIVDGGQTLPESPGDVL
jgi:3-oxoacyl-[acyl-carrier protein] reductase